MRIRHGRRGPRLARRGVARRGLEAHGSLVRGSRRCGELRTRVEKRALDSVYSVTAIIACYKDGQAIPIMAERLERMFTKLEVDYEIIFVNDGSPDESEEAIRALSARNPRVVGITHSRNFGSQAAFRSGMELASKNAVVLMDGDLQDPPELIRNSWPNGARLRGVYASAPSAKRPGTCRSPTRVLPGVRLFLLVPIRTMRGFLAHRPARGEVAAGVRRARFVLAWLRAYVGFRQTGVPYTRPERLFGRSTTAC